MKKKILYWLSNIILLIYLIIYVPIWKSLIAGDAQYVMPYERGEKIYIISILVLIVCIISRVIFNAKKLEISKANKIINIFVMICLIIALVLFSLIFTVA